MKEEGWMGMMGEGGKKKGEQISERKKRWEKEDKDKRKEREEEKRETGRCSPSPP